MTSESGRETGEVPLAEGLGALLARYRRGLGGAGAGCISRHESRYKALRRQMDDTGMSRGRAEDACSYESDREGAAADGVEANPSFSALVVGVRSIFLRASLLGLLTISPRPPRPSARGRKHYAMNLPVRPKREGQGLSARPVREGEKGLSAAWAWTTLIPRCAARPILLNTAPTGRR